LRRLRRRRSNARPRFVTRRAFNVLSSPCPPGARKMCQQWIGRLVLDIVGFLILAREWYWAINLQGRRTRRAVDGPGRKPAIGGPFCGRVEAEPRPARPPGWRRSADRTRLHGNSLRSGNFTGKIAILRLKNRFRSKKLPVLQWLLAQFPAQINRENISKNREFLSGNREFQLQTSPIDEVFGKHADANS
jgi:hypothetical protein